MNSLLSKATAFFEEHPRLKVLSLVAASYAIYRVYVNLPRQSLKGKVAIVTGASSGVGKSTAIRLAAEGARVAVVARSTAKLEELVSEIKSTGGEAIAVTCDASDPAQVARAVDVVEDTLGPVSLLLNIAGAGQWKPLAETSSDEARQMMDSPYICAFNFTRELLPGFVARNAGSIANINSPACMVGFPGAAAYGCARWALRGLSEVTRADVRGLNVSVSHVILGEVSSGYWQHNPGSRERLPLVSKVLPAMTPDTAAKHVVTAIRARKHEAVEPILLRPLFVLNQFAPGLISYICAFPSRPYFLRPIV